MDDRHTDWAPEAEAPVEDLEIFLNPERRETAEFVASKDLLDRHGNPVTWRIRRIDALENDRLLRRCTKKMPVRGKPNTFTEEVDYGLYSRLLSITCTLYPPLDSASLQERFGAMNEEELFRKVLSLGEQAEYSAYVRELNGFEKSFADEVDEAKN